MTDVQETPATAAIAAAAMLQHLGPGPLADLRRMEPDDCAPTFWRLAARHPDTIGRRHEAWAQIVRIIAILTPKGAPESRPPLHNPNRRLGSVLCDGGNPQWRGPNAVYSDRRLMKLIASRGGQRGVLLTLAARTLARTMVPGSGLNVPDIAYALLFAESPETGRRLAESYYRRLDRAASSSTEHGESE